MDRLGSFYKKVAYPALLTLLFLYISSSILAAAEEQEQHVMSVAEINKAMPEYVPGEIIVNFKEGANPDSILKELHVTADSIGRVYSTKSAVTKFLRDYKLEKESNGWYWFLGKEYKGVEEIPDEELFQEAYQKMDPAERSLYRSYKLKLPKGTMIEYEIAKLRTHPNIEYAEPNYIGEGAYIPNDPSYPLQWAHTNTCTKDAWDITKGSPEIVIAIIDTGVDYTHEDLKDHIWRDESDNPGKDFVNIDKVKWNSGNTATTEDEDYTGVDNEPLDVAGHGTRCAGIAAAVGDNNIGIAGVAYNCKIMPVRAAFKILVLGSSWVSFEEDNLASAIIYAADNGADVINMSIVMRKQSDLVKGAIAYAYSQGVVIVAAAGNDGNDDPSGNYIASGDYVIAVSATTINDSIASYSNCGSWIDVAAPGGDWSVVNSAILSTKTGGGYDSQVGTSWASSYVAGVVGLILSVNPHNITNEQAITILKSSADKIGDCDPLKFGSGRVNAYKAVTAMATCVPSIDSFSIREGSIAVADVTYTVAGYTIASYILDYSTTANPGIWNEILSVSGSAPVDGAQATFPLPVGSGKAEVRLRITNKLGTIFEANKALEYETLRISYPKDYGIITDRNIDILGSATGCNFSTYTLECSGGIGIIHGPDSNHVEDGVLGVLDGSLLSENQMYTLTLTAQTTDGRVEVYEINLSVIKGMLAGWPVSLIYQYGGNSYEPLALKAPVVGDIDNDGYRETVVSGYLGTDPGDVIGIYRYDGTPQAGWPKLIDGALISHGNIVLGDLDADGTLEIIMATEAGLGANANKVFVWHSDGTELSGWPKSYDGELKGVILADMDRDGVTDIIVTTCSQTAVHMEAWNAAGEPLEGWPVTIQAPGALADLQKGAVAGDTLGDKFKEVIIAVSSQDTGIDSTLVILDHSGNQLLTKPISGVYQFSAPSLADMDKDGYSEIILGSDNGSSSGDIYIYKADGRVLSGWPKEVAGYPAHISIADFENDLSPEIIVGTECSGDNMITVFDCAGDIKPGWPYNFGADSQGLGQDPVVGDINADGRADIMAIQRYHPSTPEPHYELQLHAWDYDGNPLSSYPKTLSADAVSLENGSSPSITDLNKDGITDIVIPTGENGCIFAYSLAVPYSENNMPWPVYRHDYMHTGSQPTHEGNHTPFMEQIGDKTVDEGQPLEFKVLAYDYDGDILTYSAESLPEGATFIGGTFYWLPSYKQAATYAVTFKVSDTEFTVSETITITVNNVNNPPVLDSIGNKQIDENQLLEFTLSGSDINGDTLTYSVSNLPNGATFTDGKFSWIPTYGQSGTYPLTFTVSDSDLEASESIIITVNQVNCPPVLDPIGDKSADEDLLLEFMLSASDLNNDPLVYSVQNAPEGAVFSAQTFSWKPSYNQAGTYSVTFQVSDGQDTDSETITITVTNVNRPPVIEPIGNKAVGIDKELSFAISASDPDGEELLCSISDIPQGATSASGVFSWIPIYEQIGTYSVTFNVSDSTATVSETIIITVREINNPPVFNSVTGRTLYTGESLVFSVSVTDLDGDYIKYQAENLPEGATFVDQTFSWIPGSSQTGTYTVTFTASDGEHTTKIEVGIQVNAAPSEPVDGSGGSPTGTDEGDSTQAQSTSSGVSSGGYFVPLYAPVEDKQDDSGSLESTFKSNDEKPAADSQTTYNRQQQAVPVSSTDDLIGQGEESYSTEDSDIAGQINFLRSVGFNDETTIEKIRDGVINFSYLVYDAKDSNHYIGNTTYSDWQSMVKTMIEQGRLPADLYYADSDIKNKVFDTYAMYLNQQNMHEMTTDQPYNGKGYNEYKAQPKLYSTESSASLQKPFEDSSATIGNVSGSKQTLFARFMQWLRMIADMIKTKASSLLSTRG